MRDEFKLFETRDSVIISIGPEPAAKFKGYWDLNHLPFIGLPDPQAKVLKLYGQEVNLFKLGRMPAQMIIDKNGMLRYIHYGHDMTDIPSNQEIIQILDQINLDWNQ